MKSMTVAELIKELRKQPQDYQVYTSVDPEGNAFGSYQADYMIGGSDEDKVLVLYPMATHMDDEIMPKETEKILEEIRGEK